MLLNFVKVLSTTVYSAQYILEFATEENSFISWDSLVLAFVCKTCTVSSQMHQAHIEHIEILLYFRGTNECSTLSARVIAVAVSIPPGLKQNRLFSFSRKAKTDKFREKSRNFVFRKFLFSQNYLQQCLFLINISRKIQVYKRVLR
jgi:hypothetical protein